MSKLTTQDDIFTMFKKTDDRVSQLERAVNRFLAGTLSGGAPSGAASGDLTGTYPSPTIAASAVTSSKILDGTIVGSDIAAGTITASNITSGTITATQISAHTITATEIFAGTITATQISANTITADKIAANTITAGQIQAGTITATEIAATTITGGKIAAGTITATNILAGTIDSSLLAADSVISTKILAGAVTASKISVSTLSAISADVGAITAGTITGVVITGGTVRTAASGARVQMSSAGITAFNSGGTAVMDFATATGNLVLAGQVTAQAGSSVPTSVLDVDATISGAVLITDGTIGGGKLLVDAITTREIAADAVTAVEILAGSVTTAKLDAGAVTAAKITAGTITSTQLTSTAIDGMVITGATVRTASSGARVLLDTTGIKAYDGSGNNTVFIDSSNGDLTATTGTLTGAVVRTASTGSRVQLDTTGIKVYNGATLEMEFRPGVASIGSGSVLFNNGASLNIGGSGEISYFSPGNIHIFRSSATVGLADGDIYYANAHVTSDETSKDNIQIITNPIDKLKLITGVSFTWKNNGSDSCGVLAQEVESVFPELVSEYEDSMSVNYNGLIAPIIEAIKELSTRVEALEG